MSNDATTGADDATPASTGAGGLSEASRRLLEESFNQGNFALIDQLVAPDAVNHDPATPADMRGLRGAELLKRTVTMYRTAFPDVRITVDDVIAADDKVVLRWHSDGTHRGELAGLAATGRQRRRENRNGPAAPYGSPDAQEEPCLEDHDEGDAAMGTSR